MNIEKIIQPGDFLTLVPFGLPVTLKYNENGVIDQVYQGYDLTTDITAKIAHVVNQLIPNTIKITGGTTWIYGVFYTSEQFICPTNDIASACLVSIVKDYTKFSFYAGAMRTVGNFQIGTALSMRQWLKTFGFNLLPGALIPKTLPMSDILKLIDADNKCPFSYPLVSNYIIYSDGIECISTNLRQYVVKKVTPHIDYAGFVSDILSCGDTKLIVPHADTVKFNIHSSTLIVIDHSDDVIYSAPTTKDYPTYSDVYLCKTCGKTTKIIPNAKLRCSNPHCSSRLYPSAQQMFKILGLPELSYNNYKSVVEKSGIVFSLPDLLDAYVTEPIKVTISQLLRAMIPYYIVPNDSNIITLLCNKCMNNVETVQYYLRNPEDIVDDFGLNNSTLVSWLSDYENVTDIKSMIESVNVDLIISDIAFDGPQIFRNKKITILGRFLHGTSDVISSIFKSYGAEVNTIVSESSSCVVVGGCHEDVSGVQLRKAQQLNLPVFEEIEFFNKYDIDTDLEQNLI